MTGRFVSTGFLLTTMFVSVAPVSAAMQVDTLQVPMDLVLSLLGGQGLDTRLFVGPVPAELEGAIPLGAFERVVGGIHRGSGGTIVVEVAESGPDALANYVDRLEAEGWSRVAMPPDRRGGFQRTDMYGQDTWCGEGYWTRASSMAFDSRTYVRVNYGRREVGRSICDVQEPGFVAGRDPFGGFVFPSLAPPPGAVVQAGGGGASSDGMDVEATVESDLGVEAVFQHYAEQLTAAGWVLRGRATGSGVALGRWEVRDDQGETVVGSMSVWALADENVFRAWLRVDRPGQRR